MPFVNIDISYIKGNCLYNYGNHLFMAQWFHIIIAITNTTRLTTLTRGLSTWKNFKKIYILQNIACDFIKDHNLDQKKFFQKSFLKR